MRHSLQRPIAPGNRLSACVCLLAVLLLWSPLWAAAWQTHTMSCCTDGMCPLHGHSHPAPPKPQAPDPAQSHSDCEHHSATQGMMNCSMSCCQDSSPSLTAGIIFVLPTPTMISSSALAIAAPQQTSAVAPVPSLDPPSPPPRATLLSR